MSYNPQILNLQFQLRIRTQYQTKQSLINLQNQEKNQMNHQIQKYTFQPNQLCYQFNVSIQKSKKHRLASRIIRGNYQNTQVCQCCNRRIGQQNLPKNIIYFIFDIPFQGVSIPLLFSYMRDSIYLLILLILTFSIYSLYSNYVGQFCTNNNSECLSGFYNNFSILNKKLNNDSLSKQNYLMLLYVIITFLVFHIFRYKFRFIQHKVDQNYITASDFALVLKRLPLQVTQNDIISLIQQKRKQLDQFQRIETNNLSFKEIIISQDLKNDLEQMNLYIQQKIKSLNNIQKESSQNLQNEIQKPKFQKSDTTGTLAIVVFDKQYSKQLFIQEPKCNQRVKHYFISPLAPLSENYKVKQKSISIQRAPQPDDIIWENCCTSIKQGVNRKILSILLTTVLLFTAGAINYGLIMLRLNIKDQDLKSVIITLTSIFVAIQNFLLGQLIVFLAKYEKMNTFTEYNDALNFKLVSFQFLNGGIFVFGANILSSFDNNSSLIQTQLAQMATQIMILNTITPNIINLIMTKYQVSKRIGRFFAKLLHRNKMSQLQLNKNYAFPVPNFPQKYSYVIKTIWLTALYAPFVPMVVIISAFGLILNYLVEQYLFSSSYSVPNMISTNLNDRCMQLFEYFPLILCIGEFLSYLYIKDFDQNQMPTQWIVIIILSMLLSLINLIIPMGQINKNLFKIGNQKSYKLLKRKQQNRSAISLDQDESCIKLL